MLATLALAAQCQRRTTVAHRSNWQFHAIEGGALLHFEDLPAFTRQLDPFWV